MGSIRVIRDAGESAKSLKRPGIAAIIERARAGTIERIVVAKLDRPTRSIRDLSDLIDLCAKHDVALVSVGESLDTSSAWRMVVNMLGVVGQWEREAIAERTAIALSHKRRSGLVYGSTPFGYRRDGNTLRPDDLEQKALREVMRLDAAGASFRESDDSSQIWASNPTAARPGMRDRCAPCCAAVLPPSSPPRSSRHQNRRSISRQKETNS